MVQKFMLCNLGLVGLARGVCAYHAICVLVWEGVAGAWGYAGCCCRWCAPPDASSRQPRRLAAAVAAAKVAPPPQKGGFASFLERMEGRRAEQQAAR